MRQALVATFVLALVTTFGGRPAIAHGGTFRGPGDSVPPGLRDPYDPVPPPPPGPTPGPTPTPTPAPAPTGGTTPTPATPTPSPTATPTLPSSTGGRSPATVTPDDWRFWYHHNKDDLENLKHALYRLDGSGAGSLFGHAGEVSTNRTAATRLTAVKTKAVIVPALLRVMDPRVDVDPDTASAAYIALAKVTTDPAHAETIRRALDPAVRHPAMVREAAALALGLLRRSAPGEPFDARALDRVRGHLFAAFEAEDLSSRVRAFAAASIGLLGDQPTGSGAWAGDADAAARATTRRLFALLAQEAPDPDLPLGLLVAIGLQPPTSLDAGQREILEDAACKGRLHGARAPTLVPAFAAHALGRTGTRAQVPVLAHLVDARRLPDEHVRRSATIGLGLLARQVDGEGRVEVARVLARACERTRDATTRNLALIALAQVLVADAHAAATDVLGGTGVAATLLETAARGRPIDSPFAALALGLVVQAIPPELDVEVWQVLRGRALGALREGLAHEGRDPSIRAAFATALGLARDAGSGRVLVDLVKDRDVATELRAYAALALGLIGNPTREAVVAIAGALRERSSETLRRQTAVALGLLGNPAVPGTGKDALALLLDELEQARSQHHKGEVVTAIARIGDHRAVEGLVALLEDPREQAVTRAMACAGLGLVGDLEWTPSLALLSRDVNYRALTDTFRELLSIL